MSEVSDGEGRTVLFVSHNMNSISSLCKSSILLNEGTLSMQGATVDVINKYVKQNLSIGAQKSWNVLEAPGNSIVKLLRVSAVDKNKAPNSFFDITEPIGIEIEYKVFEAGHILWHGINFYAEGINIFDSHSVTSPWYKTVHPKGIFKTIAWLPANLFNEGQITINVAIFNHTTHHLHLHEKDVIAFDISDFLHEDIISSRGDSVGTFPGVLRPLLNWE